MAFHLAHFGVSNATAQEIKNKSISSSKITTGSLAHTLCFTLSSASFFLLKAFIPLV